jgi:peptide deformylase
MKIITVAEENRLHEKSTAIKENVYQSEFKEMKKILKENNSLGLALPQIGINKRGFIFKRGDSYETVINPVIIKRSSKKLTKLEGCLSIPGEEFYVTRARQIQVIFRDSNMQQKTSFLSDGDARVFQHEYDHLDGTLISDSVVDEQQYKEVID